MAKTVPTTEPDEIVAGETLVWTRNLSEYPPATWTLSYEFRGAGSFTITATASAGLHSVSVPFATTDAYPVGDYWWSSYVTDGTSRYRVDTGQAKVVKDFSDATAGFDGRSHAQRTLDAIEAMIEGRATKADTSITIGDRSIKRLSPAELVQWRSVYRAEVKAEKKALRRKRGLDTQNSVWVQFTDV